MAPGVQNHGNLKRAVEIGLNSALLIASLALVSGVVYTHVTSSRNVQPSFAAPAKGVKIKISGVQWSHSQRTIVLALSSHCHFCTASARFYKRLQEAAKARGVPVVAVLPQPTDEARSYLENLGVPVAMVKQATLDSLNVSATPTLMIVDSEGKVVSSWVGQLPSSQEKDVFSAL